MERRDPPPREPKPPVPLGAPVAVVNVGLEVFAEALRAQGVQTVHVEWSVPAGGDARLLKLLKKLC